MVESLVPSPEEVGAIFDIPLEYCLTAEWPGDQSLLSKKGSEDWPYEDEYYVSIYLGGNRFGFADPGCFEIQAKTDVSWLIDGEYEYRMNRLRTPKTPLVSHPS